ncbi:peptidase S8/S53 domain-containing protein [Russula dissimulans]|nr:peptidase S8/S53 domain-containing protein [Russula dissimulans]
MNLEVTVNFSGGGFSSYFERPRYQGAAVSVYLNTIGSANAGLCNELPSRYRQSEGTSRSSPTSAGVVSLLNDQLISKQKRPLGFLSLLMYFKAYTGFDSTGSTTAEGLDLVTGFGTPDFEKCLVEWILPSSALWVINSSEPTVTES